MSYLKQNLNIRKTPQGEAIPGENQVENSAGGYVYAIDKWSRLQRFLILGTEGGTYYASQRKLTTENTAALLECIAEDGLRTVRVITEISDSGRAPKNDQAIYALALASVKGDEATRKAAYAAVSTVCRIGTHIFMWAEFRDTMTGWSRGSRRAVAEWYTEKDADTLAYQAIKYQQRDGWSHRDLLRVSHAKSEDEQIHAVLRWITRVAPESHGHVTPEALKKQVPNLPSRIEGFNRVQRAATPTEAAQLITEYNLPREAVKTEHLNSVEVWDALLPTMPLTAMIRNLATMTRIGLLTPTSEGATTVLDKLSDGEHLRKSRVHPITVLFALKTYAAGHGLRGKNTWNPLGPVVDALDGAFYAAFDNVEKTGKRKLIALDISGSMWMAYGGATAVGGIPEFTAAQAAGAMAMVSIKSGDPYEVVAFTSAGGRRGYGLSYEDAPNSLIAGLSGMSLSAKQRLDDVDHAMHRMSRYMGGTDCSLPMLYATEASRKVDVFEIYTDNETWAGEIHPSQALREYRKESGIDAKLIVVGMTATEFSIADPNDAGMMDVVGFDTSAPQLMSAFAKGQL